MMCKTQKSGATNTVTHKAGGVVAAPKNREGAGNHQRANTLPVPGVLQAKLTIGKANDPFEQEADRVASEVMRMGSKSEVTKMNQADGARSVQRQCACGGACDKCKKKQLSLKRSDGVGSSHDSSEIPSSVHEVLSGAGQPLDKASRTFMEPRFGYDFSQVRVHSNSAAARSTQELSALAFTVGNHIAFAAGQYRPGSAKTNRLLAHELAHVVQQGGAGVREHGSEGVSPSSGPQSANVSGVIQRAGDPAAIPVGFACDTDLTAGAPAGTQLPFGTGRTDIVPGVHDPLLAAFVAAWVAAGGTEDIVVHGFASTTGATAPGGETLNWNLSCQRAQHVRDALIARGIPAIHIDIDAHGTSTDFGAAPANNQVAVISSSPAGLFSNPFILTLLTPTDNFAGRSHSRLGVGEVAALDFISIPPRPAADFGGLRWTIRAGGGALSAVTTAGTATFTAPPVADVVTLQLVVDAGLTAGRVVATRTVTIVIPSGIRIRESPGTAPGTGVRGVAIPPGTFGAGFLGNVFILPTDVSFQGVVFSEGTVAGVVTPPGSFLGPPSAHPPSLFGAAHGGNLATGTAVSPPRDNIATQRAPTGSLLGRPTCGVSDFLWAIPWQFSVAGGAVTPFAIANHHETSSFFCRATIEKGGAGPFCRRINGTPC
jgi:outer membrane protein OmpA-like peptidoglycan-associated protein